MKALFVFDKYADASFVLNSSANISTPHISLFSITSDPEVNQRIHDSLHSCSGNHIEKLNSSDLINVQINQIREKICQWSAAVGNWNVGSKAVKDWLQIDGLGISAWWLNLLSEKNTLKTNAFLQLAQLHAIDQILSISEYHCVILSVSSREFTESIVQISKKHNIAIKIISVRNGVSRKGNLKEIIKERLNRLKVIGSLLGGLYYWAHLIYQSYTASKYMGSKVNRLPSEESLLFVSYFPALDGNSVDRGVFRNKYAGILQDKINELKIPVVWLLITVPIYGFEYRHSVKIAASFSDKAGKYFLLEEYLSVKDAIKGLFLWIGVALLSHYLYQRLKNNCVISEPVGKECEAIIKALWTKSFFGPLGLQGIINILIFRRIFSEIPHIKDCLYYCEMHAWEKALNAAKREVNPNVRTIGYQHSTVSRNFFNYFYDETEINSKSGCSDLPLPDIIACNGELMCSMLASSGYKIIKKVEAVRYLYLNEIMSPSHQVKRGGTPVLLVAGSMDRCETRALTALLNSAYPEKESFDIWFKAHPGLPFEMIFKEMNIDVSRTGYRICHEPMSECLKYAWALLVPTSTVSLEALAFGCEVIIPMFPDSLLMNPLSDFDGLYHKITNSGDLKAALNDIVNGKRLRSLNDYRQFIKKYWDLDSSLSGWKSLLTT